ncbi:hypothetical protein AAFF_G00416690 [Aldrovandia affinis]|uniref:Reverse transcriptase/retrotransposon-derived protein RNase H-like domain-containing protein n=1 Tax=Aldrovandia affinis TaxID=143900 RepID=A0AAD7SAG2_9TELE|nr:hypothetical protein AAFF_G00416690 [Aldrovandia affinis]
MYQEEPYIWDDPCTQVFNALQTALITAPVLAYPDANRPFVLDTDASNVGVGVILSQPSDSGEQVIAYYSRALSKTERNYCVTRRELLTAIAALRHFWPYLHGARFLVRTDHASLIWLLNFKNPEGQVARWLETLQGYDFELRHRPGRQHGNAEARAQLAPTVATLRTVDGEAGCLPLSPAQVQEAQEHGTHTCAELAGGRKAAGVGGRGRPGHRDKSLPLSVG